ncbi:unnamed protein product (macronuclear) [Paramecium tetraurelia]|uniref:Chromosome undetermined scaffold_4, whole genome shotgun sequence n=2 Tax=Paramecium TaxID=5884 RepID=A0D758_PARTE|nr:uncharacterized protein GSPATT00001916001 [Paramecium tetraurelia]XP_001450679.1 uncharacterized protein GSPATT00017626001 [Paramecium tetraurelia]CAD8135074.1 unnamed protein product [Paramecium octaurelia]CAD8140015.1 unnamed protein product [Paramecium octaurelia]CAK78875.1 unnamed protein product [Paramecium tetraurelia]CAK83282.1 unnamed protein product [Paramecium tetraurelia]|eukprot:XP_001446272.1 hypothetical protein (macronuclear) [Paramecium tetraurelia strain d4-2]
MGQCQVPQMQQIEDDFAAIQRNAVTLKAVPEKLNQLEAQINGIKSTAEQLTTSVNHITQTLENIRKSLP